MRACDLLLTLILEPKPLLVPNYMQTDSFKRLVKARAVSTCYKTSDLLTAYMLLDVICKCWLLDLEADDLITYVLAYLTTMGAKTL
jgi:hypothetical protein